MMIALAFMLQTAVLSGADSMDIHAVIEAHRNGPVTHFAFQGAFDDSTLTIAAGVTDQRGNYLVVRHPDGWHVVHYQDLPSCLFHSPMDCMFSHGGQTDSMRVEIMASWNFRERIPWDAPITIRSHVVDGDMSEVIMSATWLTGCRVRVLTFAHNRVGRGWVLVEARAASDSLLREWCDRRSESPIHHNTKRTHQDFGCLVVI